jgi:dopamine receptor D1
MMSIIFIILFLSCTARNIVIYRQAKILLRESRIAEATPADNVVANNQSSTVVTPMFIHGERKKLGEMEMEATQTLIVAMTSLCVMPCLNVIFSASFLSCFWRISNNYQL